MRCEVQLQVTSLLASLLAWPLDGPITFTPMVQIHLHSMVYDIGSPHSFTCGHPTPGA